MANSLPAALMETAARHGNRPAFKVRDGNAFRPIDYASLEELVLGVAAGLLDMGFGKGDHIAIISNNRLEWIVSDLAILSLGGADVPRGSDSTADELAYIIRHSDAVAAFVEDESQLEKLRPVFADLPSVRAVIVMDERFKGGDGKRTFPFDALLARGRARRAKGDRGVEAIRDALGPDDLATIIYTSGTTGTPKGVMLTHGNLIHNARVIQPLLGVSSEDRFLSILPSWHILERIAEYCAVASGCSTAYSNPRTLAEDLILEKPTVFVTVPRIWEGIYSKICQKIAQESAVKKLLFSKLLSTSRAYRRSERILNDQEPAYSKVDQARFSAEKITSRLATAALGPLYRLAQKKFEALRSRTGGALRLAISGGGALPAHVDVFFDAVGITIVEGYGLTETAAGVAIRRKEGPVLRTVGPPMPETEIEIRDEKGSPLPHGRQGIVHIRGPQVMKGYYKDANETAKALSADGWLNTGDLGRITLTGELAITGRAKDTIVLLGGENVEPEPLEAKICESDMIAQALIVGQDQKSLGALIVPDREAAERFAQASGISKAWPGILAEEAVISLLKTEIKRLVSIQNGFKPYELIGRFHLLPEEFKVGVDLTHTLKKKRNFIMKKYEKEIRKLYE
ncbi:MAG: AMP-binding protein [Nitrospirota bacterium]